MPKNCVLKFLYGPVDGLQLVIGGMLPKRLFFNLPYMGQFPMKDLQKIEMQAACYGLVHCGGGEATYKHHGYVNEEVG